MATTGRKLFARNLERNMFSVHSRNMFYVFLGDFSAKLIGFIATTYLARVLDTDGFGMINIGLAVLTYGLLFSTLGLQLFGTGQIARGQREEAAFTGQLLFTRIFLGMIIFFGIWLFSEKMAAGEDAVIPGIIVTYSMFLFPGALLLDWFFQGKGQMGVVAVGRFAHMVVYLVLNLLFVHGRGDILTTAWAWVVGGFANALVLGSIFYRRGYQIEPVFSLRQAIHDIRRSLPLGISTIISQIVLQFPVLYLGWYASSADVGVFSAAFRLMLILLVVDRIFYTVFFPAITRRARNDPGSLPELTNRVLKIVTLTALMCGLAAIFSADWLVPLIFGTRYLPAIPIFQTLTGYFVFTMMNSVVGYTLVGLGNYPRYNQAFLGGFALFFLAMLLLGPALGMPGVVASLTLYQFAALLLLIYFLQREFRFRWWASALRPLCGAFLVVLPALWYLHLPSPVTLGLIGGLIFPLLLWLGGVERSDWDFLKRILL